MENEILQRLDAQDKKLDAIFASAEKTRRYFLWFMIAMLVSLVLPLVGLAFAVPQLMSIYSSLGV